MKSIDIDIKCPACKGTGIYVGVCERNGAGVVCHKCNGTGKFHYHYEYEEFTEREKRYDIKRVYKDSYGYVIAPTIVNFKHCGEIDLTQEGVSYEEFIFGIQPKHIEKLVCPLRAEQNICHKLPNFIDKCHVLNNGHFIMEISSCKYQPHKADCWERFYNSFKAL